jgi:hypothetical protein
VRRFMTRRALVIVGAAIVVFAGGVAFADSSTGSGSSFVDSLARHLGISTQKLQDAAKAAALDQVDQALSNGTITKDQADRLKQRINDGQYPLSGKGGGPGFGVLPRFGHGPFGPGFGFRFGFGLRGYASAAADYLGLSQDDLLKKLQAGQSLADVAKAQNKSVGGLEDALKAAAKKQLDQAVTDKRITADQEQKALDRLATVLDKIVNAKMPFRPSIGPRADGFGGPLVPFAGRPFLHRGFGFAPARLEPATHI